MGLDAVVHCDCYVKGRLRTPPPRPELVYVDKNGVLNCNDGDDDEIYFEFQRWLCNQACEHTDGLLAHEHLGNLSLIGRLRAELENAELSFPSLLGKVLYNGTHSGDFIEAAEARQIDSELSVLSSFHSIDPEAEARIRSFEFQMRKIVIATLQTGNPISF